MRARNIKPGIFKNEQLAACSIGARWLFPGLWCLADWCGRLEDRPLRIKMEIFPADSVEVGPLLDELVGAGLNRMAACDGLGVVLEALQRAEDAQDPAVRKAKDMGLLSRPQNFVAAACGKWLKGHGKSLPRPPGPRVQTAAVEPGRSGQGGQRGLGGRV